jgi:histidine ammonia-lyase
VTLVAKCIAICFICRGPDRATHNIAECAERLRTANVALTAALQAAEREAVERGKDIETLTTGLTVMQARAEAVETALRRHGYRRSCDSPACNCGDQWTHGGHAARRLTEVAEVLGERTQGRTILAAVQTLLDEHGALTTALQTAETVLRRRKLHHRCP